MRPQGSTTSGLENRQGSVNGDSSESGVDEAGGRSDCKMKLNGPNGPNGGKKRASKGCACCGEAVCPLVGFFFVLLASGVSACNSSAV